MKNTFEDKWSERLFNELDYATSYNDRIKYAESGTHVDAEIKIKGSKVYVQIGSNYAIVHKVVKGIFNHELSVKKSKKGREQIVAKVKELLFPDFVNSKKAYTAIRKIFSEATLRTKKGTRITCLSDGRAGNGVEFFWLLRFENSKMLGSFVNLNIIGETELKLSAKGDLRKDAKSYKFKSLELAVDYLFKKL
jgi:hypothetical protein